MQFAAAQNKCRDMGGNLASFTSQNDINRMILGQPNQPYRPTDPSWEYWTGLAYYSSGSSGSWSFVDGTNTSFALTLLDPNPTSSYYDSDKCVLISGERKLRAITCDERRKYICQIAQHEITTDITASSG